MEIETFLILQVGLRSEGLRVSDSGHDTQDPKSRVDEGPVRHLCMNLHDSRGDQ